MGTRSARQSLAVVDVKASWIEVAAQMEHKDLCASIQYEEWQIRRCVSARKENGTKLLAVGPGADM